MHVRIVKLGGSLLDLPDLAERFQAWLSGQSPGVTLLVVGGGALADAIRQAQTVHGLDDAAAHRLCVDVMGVTAALACDLLPEATLVRRPDEIDRTGSSGLQVVDVREFLAAACDPLPESWHVTSDSIAAHLARLLEADELVLLKSTLPQSVSPRSSASARQQTDQGMVSAKALTAAGLVDDYFPQAAEAFLAGDDSRGRDRGRVRLVDFRDPQFAEVSVRDLPTANR